MKEVKVVQDSGTGINFISPGLARACNLTAFQTADKTLTLITGQVFVSNSCVEVKWQGRDNKEGTHWFYLAPERAPIHLLVGADFLRDYPDVFRTDETPMDPMFLNVQTRITVSEKRWVYQHLY